MSQENVELVRRLIEAWNRRDIESVLQGMDPEIQFEHRLAALQGKLRRPRRCEGLVSGYR